MKMKFIKICSLALVLLPAMQLKAQWTSDTLMNTVVSDQAGIEEATPLQASTSDGKTYISWFEQSPGINYAMKMQLLDAQGNKMWGAGGLLVSNHLQNSALYRYDLKIDNDDNAILAFQDMRTGTLSTIVYKMDSAQNFLWGVNGIALHDTNATFELAPAIGILSGNDIVIAWNASNAGSSKWVPFQKISASGIPLWSQPLTLPGTGKYSRPIVSGMSNNEFVIVYIEETGAGFPPTSTLKSMRYDSSGTAVWTTVTQISAYGTTFVFIPRVAKDDNDGFFAGFDCGTPGAPSINDVFIQRVSSNGMVNWGANGVEVSSLSGNNKNLVNILYRHNDGHLYALLKMLDGSQNLAGAYAQALDTSGNKLLTANGTQILPLSSADYHEPFGWADAGDGFITVYTQGGFANEKLYAKKIDYNGQPLWTPSAASLSAVASNKLNVTVGDYRNNQAVVVWEDERMDRGVYAQNINTNGSTGIASGFDETPAGSEILLLQNPVIDEADISICLNESKYVKIFVVDLLGKEVLNYFNGELSTGFHSFGIKVNDFRKGLYFVKVQTLSGNKVFKMIIE